MCFSVGFLVHVLIMLVFICAAVAIIRLLLPYITSVGVPGIVVQIINIIIWVIVAVAIIYFVAELLGCLAGNGGFGFGYSDRTR